jgi:ankyrin repeat protein
VNNERREGNKLLFEEEEDKSDIEDPWDEASDRSESDDRPRVEERGAVEENDAVKVPDAVELNANYESEEVEGDGAQMSSSPNSPPNQCPIPKKADEKQGKATSKKPVPKTPIGKPRKKARIIEKIEHVDGTRSKHGGRISHTHIPYIVIDPAEDAQSEAPLLSKDNMRSMGEERKSPITPRKRNALMPVDIRNLMDNTWEMASSAPTSVISEEIKSKIIKFFFMIPNDEEIKRLLGIYCKKGSASAVKTILNKVSSKTKLLKRRRYFVPLIHAVQGASSRHNKCVRELLAAGVDPNLKSNRSGLTPLHIAVQNPNFKGYTNLIWLLLSNGANPNALNRNDEVPLAQLFIGADTVPLEVHKRGALIMLLKEGAAPNFTLAGTGNTPLHLAVRRQDKVVVALLLHKGAEVDAKNTSGTTPLQMTANQFRGELSADHAEVLDHLLQNGASVDERAGVQGRTALHWAVIAGCAQAVAMLLEAGANAKLQDWVGHDAMTLAVKSADKLTAGGDEGKLADHVEIMLGLERAAQCGWRLEEGSCAVETACKRKDGQLLEMLLKMGLDPNSKFRETTIMGFATRAGSDVAKRLLRDDATFDPSCYGILSLE